MIAIGLIGYEVISILSDLGCTIAFLKAYKYLKKIQFTEDEIQQEQDCWK